jgi:hypothetical protein
VVADNPSCYAGIILLSPTLYQDLVSPRVVMGGIILINERRIRLTENTDVNMELMKVLGHWGGITMKDFLRGTLSVFL